MTFDPSQAVMPPAPDFLSGPGPRVLLTGRDIEGRNTQSAPSKIQRREWLQVWKVEVLCVGEACSASTQVDGVGGDQDCITPVSAFAPA